MICILVTHNIFYLDVHRWEGSHRVNLFMDGSDSLIGVRSAIGEKNGMEHSCDNPLFLKIMDQNAAGCIRIQKT